MIKNLVFDMGNVLLDYNPMRTLETLFQDPEVRQAVYQAVFRSPEWRMGDAGTITDDGLIAASVAREPRYEQQIRRAVAVWHTDLPPLPGMEDLLKALKDKGYALYLLSNVSTRFRAIKEICPLLSLMDGCIASAEHKLVKPDLAIYELLLRRFGLEAGECLFIDDLPANIEGARAAGMQAHLFTGAPELVSYLTGLGIL